MRQEIQDPVARMHAEHLRRRRRNGGRRSGMRQNYLANALYPFSYVFALLTGIAAALGVRYVQFHMLGMPAQAENPDMQLVVDNALALAAAFVIGALASFKTKEHVLAQMAGVWMVILCLHNAVHWYPDLFAEYFSMEWVSEVKAATVPNSIMFRGAAFEF